MDLEQAGGKHFLVTNNRSLNQYFVYVCLQLFRFKANSNVPLAQIKEELALGQKNYIYVLLYVLPNLYERSNVGL